MYWYRHSITATALNYKRRRLPRPIAAIPKSTNSHVAIDKRSLCLLVEQLQPEDSAEVVRAPPSVPPDLLAPPKPIEPLAPDVPLADVSILLASTATHARGHVGIIVTSFYCLKWTLFVMKMQPGRTYVTCHLR